MTATNPNIRFALAESITRIFGNTPLAFIKSSGEVFVFDVELELLGNQAAVIGRKTGSVLMFARIEITASDDPELYVLEFVPGSFDNRHSRELYLQFLLACGDVTDAHTAAMDKLVEWLVDEDDRRARLAPFMADAQRRLKRELVSV